MDEFGYSPDPMFGFMSIVGPIFFLAILGVFVVVIFQGVRRWNHNNGSPVLTVPAKVVNMRHEARGDHTRTWYYVTFEVESGDRMELELSGEEFGLLALHDIGRLTFQGTRYKGFDRVKV